MLQIILTLVIFVLLIIPIGRYMFHIATGQHTFCDPVFNRIDNGIYRICGINQNEGMGWKMCIRDRSREGAVAYD